MTKCCHSKVCRPFPFPASFWSSKFHFKNSKISWYCCYGAGGKYNFTARNCANLFPHWLQLLKDWMKSLLRGLPNPVQDGHRFRSIQSPKDILQCSTYCSNPTSKCKPWPATTTNEDTRKIKLSNHQTHSWCLHLVGSSLSWNSTTTTLEVDILNHRILTCGFKQRFQTKVSIKLHQHHQTYPAPKPFAGKLDLQMLVMTTLPDSSSLLRHWSQIGIKTMQCDHLNGVDTLVKRGIWVSLLRMP